MKTLAGKLAFAVGLPGFRLQLQLVLVQELAETLRSKICFVDLMCDIMYVYYTRGTPRISLWLLGSSIAMLQIAIKKKSIMLLHQCCVALCSIINYNVL